MNSPHRHNTPALRAARALLALVSLALTALTFFWPDAFAPLAHRAANTFPPIDRNNETLFVKDGYIFAPILARPRWSAYDTFVVARGTRDGVYTGARVFARSFALGFVSEVYERTALVSLYSTPGRTTTTLLAGTFPIDIVGLGSGTFEGIVASGAPIAPGDEAYAPALSPHPFALVGSRVENSGEGNKILLRLPLNIFELAHVEIER